MEIEIKLLTSNNIHEFEQLLKIFHIVFEHDVALPSKEYLQNLLSKEDFKVFVAKVDGSVVGGLTIYVLHGYYSEKPQAFIYDVGIEPSFQGRGIGKKLLNEVLGFCKDHGYSEAFVEAEGDDDEAIAFYRRTKPDSEMNAIQFTYTID